MTLHVKVRINPENKDLPLVLTVTGAGHCADFTETFVNHGDVWAAARKVSETEQDYRVANGPGW